MSETLGSATLILKVDSSGLNKGVADAQKLAQGLDKKFQEFGSRVTDAGKKLSLFVTGPLTLLGAGAVHAASDLQESLNAVNVVFGDSAKIITDWSSTASQSAGLAAADVNQAATRIGSQLQNFGLSADEAAKNTVMLAQRAADMASVFNTDVNDALTAIQAGLRGEADPLERFGVGLNQAAIEAFALDKGLVKSGQEMTDQQKIVARLGLLMEQTNKVQGDFANTSDGFANSMRILKADVTNLGAEFGTMMLPALQSAVGFARDAVSWFKGLSDETKQIGLIIATTFAVTGPALIAIGLAIKAVNTLIITVNALKVALALVSGPIGIIAAAVGVGVTAWMLYSDEIKSFLGVAHAAETELTVVEVKVEETTKAIKKQAETLQETRIVNSWDAMGFSARDAAAHIHTFRQSIDDLAIVLPSVTENAVDPYNQALHESQAELHGLGDAMSSARGEMMLVADSGFKVAESINEASAAATEAGPNFGTTFAGIGNQAAGQVAGASGAIAGFQTGGPVGAAAGFIADLLFRNEKFRKLIEVLNETLVTMLDPIVDAIAPSLKEIAPLLSAAAPFIRIAALVLKAQMAPLAAVLRTLNAGINKLTPNIEGLSTSLEDLGDIIKKLGKKFGGGGGGFKIPGFHSGSFGPLHRNDLARAPGLQASEGLAVLREGEIVTNPAMGSRASNVTIALHGSESATYSKNQVRELIRRMREELRDDSMSLRLSVV